MTEEAPTPEERRPWDAYSLLVEGRCGKPECQRQLEYQHGDPAPWCVCGYKAPVGSWFSDPERGINWLTRVPTDGYDHLWEARRLGAVQGTVGLRTNVVDVRATHNPSQRDELAESWKRAVMPSLEGELVSLDLGWLAEPGPVLKDLGSPIEWSALPPTENHSRRWEARCKGLVLGTVCVGAQNNVGTVFVDFDAGDSVFANTDVLAASFRRTVGDRDVNLLVDHATKKVLAAEQLPGTDEVNTLLTIIVHRELVSEYLGYMAAELQGRARVHDRDKLSVPLFHGFVEVNRVAREHPFGSPEYMASLKTDAVGLHVRRNRHHPEAHRSPADMTWLDIVEMVCDWGAAALTYGQTSLADSLEVQRKRFDFTDQQWWLIEQVVATIDAAHRSDPDLKPSP